MKIAFIGLGHMGGGMAPNLAKAGHEVRAFDLSEDALKRAVEHGCKRAKSAAEACKEADAVVTMLPAGKHVAEVYRAHVFGKAPTSAILIDCSTIDVATAKAMEMCLTGRMMGAEEAERSGLVARVVPAADLVDEALKTAETIASMAPLAAIATKEMVNAAFEMGLAQGINFERRLFHGLFGTQDQKEGMTAFVEKRPGNWTGR